MVAAEPRNAVDGNFRLAHTLALRRFHAPEAALCSPVILPLLRRHAAGLLGVTHPRLTARRSSDAGLGGPCDAAKITGVDRICGQRLRLWRAAQRLARRAQAMMIAEIPSAGDETPSDLSLKNSPNRR